MPTTRMRPRSTSTSGRVDFVILTHAHIDHSGLLPRLAARGFAGPVYATPATIDLLGVMLPDSAHIQEMEAARRTRANCGIGPATCRAEPPGAPDERGVLPLYTVADAERSLRLLQPVGYDAMFEPRECGPLPLPRRGPHPRLGDRRGLGRRAAAARASSCSPAISGSPDGR